MKCLMYAMVLVCTIAFTACTTAQEQFPDSISVSKTTNMHRVKGTRIFVALPANYKPIETMVRLQRDNNTYFQVMTVPNTNFAEYKKKLTKAAIESQGAKVDISMPVKYNGYDGVYFVGPSKFAGETKLALCFGDENFVVMLMAVCKTADKVAREELNKLFYTSFYDSSFSLNPLELVDYTFDESITGFKYATAVGQMFVYTLHGKADMEVPENVVSVFQLMEIEAPSFSKAKEFVDYTLSRYEVAGIAIKNMKKQDLLVDGNEAYEVTMEGSKKGEKSMLMYTFVIHKGSKAVVFNGTDDMNGKWIAQFKETAKSIRLK